MRWVQNNWLMLWTHGRVTSTLISFWIFMVLVGRLLESSVEVWEYSTVYSGISNWYLFHPFKLLLLMISCWVSYEFHRMKCPLFPNSIGPIRNRVHYFPFQRIIHVNCAIVSVQISSFRAHITTYSSVKFQVSCKNSWNILLRIHHLYITHDCWTKQIQRRRICFATYLNGREMKGNRS